MCQNCRFPPCDAPQSIVHISDRAENFRGDWPCQELSNKTRPTTNGHIEVCEKVARTKFCNREAGVRSPDPKKRRGIETHSIMSVCRRSCLFGCLVTPSIMSEIFSPIRHVPGTYVCLTCVTQRNLHLAVISRCGCHSALILSCCHASIEIAHSTDVFYVVLPTLRVCLTCVTQRNLHRDVVSRCGCHSALILSCCHASIEIAHSTDVFYVVLPTLRVCLTCVTQRNLHLDVVSRRGCHSALISALISARLYVRRE